MKSILAGAFVLAFCASGSWGQDKPKETEKKDAPKRVDLLRFYDKKLKEHVYTYGEAEPTDWRKNLNMEGETVIGQVALTKEPDTTRLFRATSGVPGSKHYFYLQKPVGVTINQIDEFTVYVWTKPGDGRVPIAACWLPDLTDMYFDTDQKKVLDYAQDSLKGTGRKRGIAKHLFYIYAAAGAEEKKEGKKLDLKQLKDLADKTPRKGTWVIVDSPLDRDTAAACKIAYDSGQAIKVYLHSRYKHFSPEQNTFIKNADDKWLHNVTIVDDQNPRIGEHADKSIDVLILNDKSELEKWAAKVKPSGEVVIRK
jgi:hypothetical protein